MSGDDSQGGGPPLGAETAPAESRTIAWLRVPEIGPKLVGAAAG